MGRENGTTGAVGTAPAAAATPHDPPLPSPGTPAQFSVSALHQRSSSDAADHFHRQRQVPLGLGQRRHPAALGAARHARPHRNEVRLWHRAVWRVYRAPGRRGHTLVRDADRRGGRQARHDDRRTVSQPLPRGPEGLDRGGCAPVRLLPVGPDHGGRRAAREERQSERCRDRRRDDEHLPLRHVPADPRRHPPRRAAGLTMSAHTELTRREFLETAGAAGAGLVIAFHLPSGSRFRTAAAAPLAPNAWLRIGADESVLVIVDRSEMGQGVATALPMLLAEELDADWSNVKIEFAPADKAYTNPMFGMQGTGGSTSVRAAYTPLRKAGAAAREMLVAAAAETWGVDKATCHADKGAVIHASSKRRLTYGKLAAKAATLAVPENPTLKEPKDWKVLGTRVRRLDTPAKVDGSPQFGIDVKRPGMLVAVVARSPTIGGKVASFDATKAKAVPGVKDVVQISSGVAVVADGYWDGRKGREALAVKWDDGPNTQVTSASISQLPGEAAAKPSPQARHDGDPDGALASAASKVEAAYELPYAAHATMEPMNCTAHVRADGVDVWAPTQAPTNAQRVAAQVAGVAPKDVRLHVMMVGGGFGRRGRTDYVEEAVRLSKAIGA